MIKKLLFIMLMMVNGSLYAQFPPLEISIDDVMASVNGTVEVSIRAGTNWQNITEISGTIIYDPLVVDEPMLSFWGLSNPTGVIFQDLGSGVVTYDWEALITIGPTLNLNDVVFTLQFNVAGGIGSASQINFSNNPEQLFWANGFGWSGNNHNITNGSVTVVVGDDLIFESSFDP